MVAAVAAAGMAAVLASVLVPMLAAVAVAATCGRLPRLLTFLLDIVSHLPII